MSGTLSSAAADARFFQRFVHRRYRIRVAALCEIEEARRKGVLTVAAPEGYRAHVGVRFERGCLHRVIGVLAVGADCDMGEDDARGCFALLQDQDDAKLIAWTEGRRA